MPIYVPKRIIQIKPSILAPLFFLAGPIRGGGDWQHAMAWELLQRNGNANIAVPSRWTAEHPLRDYFVAPFTQADNRQLVWERHYMEQAALSFKQRPDEDGDPGCLVFWLGLESKTSPHPGPEPYAMDTRREVGKYTAFIQTHGARVVVGGHREFYGLDVMLNELADAAGEDSFPFYEDMGELADAAYEMAVS